MTNDYKLVFGHEDKDEDDVGSNDNFSDNSEDSRDEEEDGDEDDVDSNEDSNDDSNESEDEKEDSDTDIDSQDDAMATEARQAMQRMIMFYNDVQNNKYVMDLQDKFPSIAKLKKYDLIQIEEDEDDDDEHQTKVDILKRSHLNITIFITETLLEIVEGYDHNKLLNGILDESYRTLTINSEKFLINLFSDLYIGAEDHKAVIQEDDNDKESLEELAEKERNLRENFREKMGVDPVDPEFLLDKIKTYSSMESIEHLNLREEILSQGKRLGIRWIPPRAFSRDLIADMMDEKIEECYK